MKKTALLLLLLITYISAWSQGNTVLDFDVSNLSSIQLDKIPDHIKEGATLAIRYLNVNPFAYSSNPVFSTVNHNYQDGLSALQTGFNTITSKAGTNNPAADAGVKAGTAHEDAKALIEAVKPRKRMAVKGYSDAGALLIKDVYANMNEIRDNSTCIDAIMGLDDITKKAAADGGNNNKPRMDAAIFSSVSVYNINGTGDISTVLVNCITDIDISIGKIDADVLLLKKLKDQAPSADEKKDIANTIDSISNMLSKLNENFSDENTRTLITNAQSIIYNINQLENADFNLQPKVLATASGDFLQFSDTLKDNNGKIYFAIQPHTIKTFKGTRVDFSLGLAVNVGGNGREYAFQKNPGGTTTGPDTAKVILTESLSNKLMLFSPVIFVHWYKTTKHDIQLMISAGLAPDFSTLANTKIYLGGSFGFPSSNELAKRLVLSAGASFGFADELKAKYKGYSDYAQFSTTDASDLTEKTVHFGGFFAISYNLGGTGH